MTKCRILFLEAVTHCIHSWPEYKRINRLVFSVFSPFLRVGNSSSFNAKVLQIKTRMGQQHSPLQSAPHLNHRQRHLPKLFLVFRKYRDSCTVKDQIKVVI